MHYTHDGSLLRIQIPSDAYESSEYGCAGETETYSLVAEAFIVFHAYIELDRRVRPENLLSMIQRLLKEPADEEYLKLSIPWSSVSARQVETVLIRAASLPSLGLHGRCLAAVLTTLIFFVKVFFVDSLEGYLDAVEYLKSCEVLGFDSEWKPNQSKGPNRMALLQVASEHKVCRLPQTNWNGFSVLIGTPSSRCILFFGRVLTE